jgi:hypothetical protein
MDSVQNWITLGLVGFFIMALALFNVSFLKRFMVNSSITAILAGIVICNRTYLNQRRNKK